MDQTVLNIIVAICVVLLTLVFYLIYRWGKKTRRTVILAGICDSGKTLIYSRLMQGAFVNTHTSIKENVGEYFTKEGRSVQLVDIPGHEKLRGKFLEQYKAGAKALIYIIDSLTLQKDIRDVADYLYTLLTDSKLYNCRNVLIFCNKQDYTTAKGMPVIKSLLEKELNVIRQTRSHSLKSIDDGSESKGIFLGFDGYNFEFVHCLPTVVTFEEGYASNKENEAADPDLERLEKWISAIA